MLHRLWFNDQSGPVFQVEIPMPSRYAIQYLALLIEEAHSSIFQLKSSYSLHAAMCPGTLSTSPLLILFKNRVR